jgi:hypothetical protein
MTTDIFIKTYHKDFVWLEWCLKSIKKFAHGFNTIIIVSDDDGNTLPESFSEIIPFKIFYVGLPEKRPTDVEHGLGYLWQQNIKLQWYDYSDANEVLILDSDEMLTVPTCPDSFKTDGKFHWFFRDWNDMGNGACWRKSTEEILDCRTKNSGMCITGFILNRETSIALKNHICTVHGTHTIWDIFVVKDMRTASEFNIYGCFIENFNRTEYTMLYLDHANTYFNSTIKKDWSWGGLSNTMIEQRNAILNT